METNPNGTLTDTLAAANPTLFDGAHKDATNDGEYDDDRCHLEYFHKSKPTPEPDLTVCSPWKKGACCEAKTVTDTETIMQAYGPEYHWKERVCCLLVLNSVTSTPITVVVCLHSARYEACFRR